MALFVLGDTHFSDGAEKPMDIFGGSWIGSRQKLLDGFGNTLEEGDTLVLCGDFSWGMNMNDALPDFKLVSQFPGKKLFVKGNHDYWWETVTKMQGFLAKNQIKNIDFLHNCCYFYNGVALCGTRGWIYEKNNPASGQEKIYKREVLRLGASLEAARHQRADCEIFAFLHYPPVFMDFEAEEITGLLREYRVSKCFYGHLHGQSIKGAFSGVRNGVYYALVSADAIGFKPLKIME